MYQCHNQLRSMTLMSESRVIASKSSSAISHLTGTMADKGFLPTARLIKTPDRRYGNREGRTGDCGSAAMRAR